MFLFTTLGGGKGSSVLDVINAFKKASGVDLNYVFGPRREGDLAEYYSDPTKAFNELGWKTELTIEDMCRDSWNWREKTPTDTGTNEPLRIRIIQYSVLKDQRF